MILIARAPHLKREHYAGSKRALNLRPLPPVHRGLAESKQTALGVFFTAPERDRIQTQKPKSLTTENFALAPVTVVLFTLSCISVRS